MGQKKKKGFASMTPERLKEVCSKGGKSSQAKGNGHKWTPEEARKAGKKGGKKVSRDREYMAELGRKSAAARAKKKEEAKNAGEA